MTRRRRPLPWGDGWNERPARSAILARQALGKARLHGKAFLVAAIPLALAACAAPSTPVGHFYGTATPTPAAPLCQPSKAEAQIRNDVLIFTPDEGTWVLEGLANPDGTLTADRARPVARGQTWQTTFQGRWTQTAITGTYKTPRCTYTIALAKP